MLGANKKPAYVGSNKIIFLKKGFNIRIKGEAEKKFIEEVTIENFAVQPGNFRGVVPIPKVVVNPGDKVKAGDLLFYDKKRPELKFVSPVSGTVKAVNRGLRRSIKEVVITKGGEMEYKEFASPDIDKVSREELVDFMLESGVWPLIKQRPFDMVPEKDVIPQNIFVSTFDTSPLAPDYNFIIKGKEDIFQKGLDVLAKLTDGKVFLGLDAAANFFYDEENQQYILKPENSTLNKENLINLYKEWSEKYNLISLEDGLEEEDWKGWAGMNEKLGGELMLIGDDLLVTNPQRLQKAIDEKACNAALVKPNQIGTLTETIEYVRLAQENKMKIIVSHRSGETIDDFIADLAVGIGADYIKTGSLSRGERLAKYNRLLEIND